MKSWKMNFFRTIKVSLPMAVILATCVACASDDYMSYEEYGNHEITEITVKDSYDDGEYDIDETGSDYEVGYDIDTTGSSDFVYKPVMDYPGNGNFEDITFDFAESYLQADVVDRWYEDGFSNGYYLDIYGNGTWEFCGDKTVHGTYDAGSHVMWLTDSMYGLDVMQVYFSREYDTLYVSFMNHDVISPRYESFESKCFLRLDDCTVCDDFDTYYGQSEQMRAISGKWVPETDELGSYAIVISEGGTWSELKSGVAFEVGLLKDLGNGVYEASEGNAGGTRTFEIKDGHLYYDGYSFVLQGNKMGEGPAPARILGKWLLDDEENGGWLDQGYILNEDWTFSQFEGDQTIMTGRFIMLEDDILLYDSEGNQVFKMSQLTFMEFQSIDARDEEGKEISFTNEDYANSLMYSFPDAY